MTGIRRMVGETLWKHDDFVKQQRAVEEEAARIGGEAGEEYANLHDVDRALWGCSCTLAIDTGDLPALVEDLMLLFWKNADKLMSAPSIETAKRIARGLMPTGYDDEVVEEHANWLIKELKSQ